MHSCECEECKHGQDGGGREMQTVNERAGHEMQAVNVLSANMDRQFAKHETGAVNVRGLTWIGINRT